MKTSLVCIAKNEDHYINEWIRYHLFIGFDKIFIYCNDWKFENSFQCKVISIDYPGIAVQMNAYNDFLQVHNKEFDWALFIDVDEFLSLGKFKTVNDMFTSYNDFYAVGFNWKIFGSNGQEKVVNGNYSVAQRFIRSQLSLNRHIKTAVNLNKCRQHKIMNDIFFMTSHFVNRAQNDNFTIDATRTRFIKGPWNYIIDNPFSLLDTPYIAHYAVKSKQEFLDRRQKIRADTGYVREDLNAYWEKYNLNQIHNFDILNILNKFKGETGQ